MEQLEGKSMKTQKKRRIAIIGAGPYGIAAAAHLRGKGMDFDMFGQPMAFWADQMPEGMVVRSTWDACHISDPEERWTLDAYAQAHHLDLVAPLDREEFVRYGIWVQTQVAPDVDGRRVVDVRSDAWGFSLALEDGEVRQVDRVVVAAGIGQSPRIPIEFQGVVSPRLTHSSQHKRMDVFAGKRVAVVGGGQTALESAALLHENGAEVTVLVRRPKVHFLDQTVPWLKSEANPLRRVFYPPSDVGPPGLNWIVATPGLFRCFPKRLQDQIAARSIRPAGSGWLVPRLRNVAIRTGACVTGTTDEADGIRLHLSDGSDTQFDHVYLATGYRVDLRRYSFLGPELLSRIEQADGYPILKRGLESSVPGLHFMGAPAAHSFGPLCRFVSGTKFAGRALAAGIAGAPAL
jgi:thioredoxin reductase